MHIGYVPTWIQFRAMQIECTLNHTNYQPRWIGTEYHSSNNNKITHSYSTKNSNIIEAFTSTCRPPYMLYLPSKM